MVLSVADRQELQGIANSRSMPHSLVLRAKIMLVSASGEQNKTVAENVGIHVMMVEKWRRRYLDKRVAGFHDALRRGRPRTDDDEEVAKAINLVLQTKPDDDSTHRSTCSLAVETGGPKSTVQRWLHTFSLQPPCQ